MGRGMVVNDLRQATVSPPDNLPMYEAVDLTKGGDLAHIKLNNQLYTLRITRAGKLKLTK